MSFNSGVALELLGSYAYYTSTTTEYLRDKPVVAEIARRAFPGAAISEVKSGANANGKYLYMIFPQCNWTDLGEKVTVC